VGLMLLGFGGWKYTADIQALKRQQAEDAKNIDYEANAACSRELETLPFAGLIQYSDRKPVPCTTVEAELLDSDRKTLKRVSQGCDQGLNGSTGTFAFGPDFRADPRTNISLVVRVGDKATYKVPVTRSKERLA